MKIVLINPYNVGWSGLQNILQIEPIGLEIIGTYLQEDHDVYILDLRFEPDLESFLSRYKPDFVGISCLYTSHINATWDIASRVKKVLPACPIAVGGQPATIASQFFNSIHIDFIVKGDGEVTMPELCKAIEKGSNLFEVPGLIINRDGIQYTTKKRAPADNLDKTLAPNRHLPGIDRSKYYMALSYKVGLFELTRGCKYRCNFCSIWQFAEGDVRSRSVDKAVEEIARIPERRIFVADDHFFFDADYMRELGEAIAAANLQKSFTVQSRADVIANNPDMIDIWTKAGLNTVFLGIDGHSNKRLRLIRKSSNLDLNEGAAKVLSERGINLAGNMMIDPKFTKDEFKEVADYIESSNLGFLTFCIATPLPGTDLWKKRRSEITTLDFSLYDLAHAVMETQLPLEEFYEQYVGLWKLRAKILPKLWEKPTLDTIYYSAKTDGVSLRLIRNFIRFSTEYTKVENYLRDHGSTFKKPELELQKNTVVPELKELSG
ncbi:MAG: radical SAM protein [Thermodesulfobacteriota bacterium]